MELTKCIICGKRIDIKYRKKDYGVFTHYKEGKIYRDRFCSIHSKMMEAYIETLKKKAKEEYLEKHPEYKYFNFLGRDRDTGLLYYALKDKLEKETWDRVADLFVFCGYSDVDTDIPDSARGRWITHNPRKVMEKLSWD